VSLKFEETFLQADFASQNCSLSLQKSAESYDQGGFSPHPTPQKKLGPTELCY